MSEAVHQSREIENLQRRIAKLKAEISRLRKRQPLHEEIAIKAYELWEEDSQLGTDYVHTSDHYWYEAEAILRFDPFKKESI